MRVCSFTTNRKKEEIQIYTSTDTIKQTSNKITDILSSSNLNKTDK